MTAELGLDELAAIVPDGATVGIGGAGLQRKPMTLLRRLADAGRRDLRVVAFLGSVDVELLIAAGCVSELHCSGVALDGAGLAPRYRAARQTGSPRVLEWSEGTLLLALEAVARGVPSLPTWMALETDLPSVNPHLRPGKDPFDGTEVMHVQALALDVALLHLPAVDAAGNGYVSGDLAADGLMARAAKRTVVSFEERCEPDPGRVALGRLWITDVLQAPRGASPAGCHPAYAADSQTITRWARQGAEAGPELLAAGG